MHLPVQKLGYFGIRPLFLGGKVELGGGHPAEQNHRGEAPGYYGGPSSYPNMSGKPIDPLCHKDQKQRQGKNQITGERRCINGDPLQGHKDWRQNDRSTQQKERSLLSYRRPTAG